MTEVDYVLFAVFFWVGSSLEVAHIVKRATPEELMLMYSLPAFVRGDVTAFLSGVARSNHLVKKVSYERLFYLIMTDSLSFICVIIYCDPSSEEN
jgi:hypothetical protein